MSTVRIDPAAAAASLAGSGGAPLPPGAAFAVYRLGRSSFRAAVARRVDDGYAVLAERSEPIGGAEFDELLLAYLSGRHPDAGVRLWSRIDDPSDPADRRLRALLLDKVARAREQLSEREFTVITVPAADVKLPLTREELDASIQELIGATADLVEEALAEAGVAPQELAGLLMAGGAARTPLAAVELRRRLGVEPVLAAPTAPAVEEPPAEPVPTRELPELAEEPPDPEAPARRRPPVRLLAVAGAVLAVLLGAVAAFGAGLGDEDAPAGGEGAEEAVTASDAPAPSDPAASPGPSESASEDEASSGPPSPGSSGAEEPPEPDQSESVEEAEEPATEAAPTGTVPDVVGMSTAEAREAAGEAGFTEVTQVGEERGFWDWSHADCEVIGQEPPAGEVLPLSEAVTVTFSYGGDEGDCDA